MLRGLQDEGSHLVYISPLPSSALSMAAVDSDAYSWGALAAAAAGASLAGLASVAMTDAELRAPHVEVTNVHVGWDFGTEAENRKSAKVGKRLLVYSVFVHPPMHFLGDCCSSAFCKH